MTNTLNIENGVATLEFSSPNHNSLKKEAMHDLAEKLDSLSDREDVRVVVIRSGGDRTFCAGADFGQLHAVANMEESVEFFGGFARLFMAIYRCPKIVIARVQGKSAGGALGILCSADLSYGTEHAAVKLSELNVGIGPFVVGAPIERKVGIARLGAMTLSPNKFYDAEWAKSVGFYTEVFADIEAMDAAIRDKCAELGGYNPEALLQIKKILRPDPEQMERVLEERKLISASLLLGEFAQARIKELAAGSR